MLVTIEKNGNGSYTFSGYMKRTYYGYTLALCKRLYREESKKSGYNGRIVFVKM